ncbi:MAG: amidohydrolase family protein, partial [Rubrobacter sp.]|nr:amidohydrolase family protein [Rubrobacter sp.]
DSAREAVEAGTTYMAESSPYGECLPQLAESGMAGMIFAEFFPVEFDSPEESADFISRKVEELRRGIPERLGAHASVHAPYTIHPTAARLVARRAAKRGDPLAIHLSESREEVEFFREGTGLLTELGGAEWAGQGISPVAYAENTGLLGPRTIAAHVATGVSDEDLDILARTDTAVVHCPRSNRNLGCGTARVPEMLQRGIRVGMGTDGLWSSDDMSLWAETLAAAELHGFNGTLSLELATIRGARALGVEDEIGTLEAGKRADLTIIENAPDGSPDVGREVLETAASGGVSATVVSGRLIYNRIDK